MFKLFVRQHRQSNICIAASLYDSLSMLLLSHERPCGGTSDILNAVLAWSSQVCATGEFPWVDWEGKPWPEGSWRAKMAGKRLADDFIFLFVEIAGDWKFIKEEFKLRASYAHKEICSKCFAAKNGHDD